MQTAYLATLIMSQPNDIEYVKNQYKPETNYDWMRDSVYDDFASNHLKNVHSYHQTIPGYQNTPLVDLTHFANEIGVGKVHVKDESKRFNLNAFKVLGASYSLAKVLVGNKHQDKTGI